MPSTTPLGLLGVALMALTFHLSVRHIGLSLWDEGFLWYGAQRVVAGEVPLRDFQSYDPGRYYMAAAFMRMLESNGILAVRACSAALLALTVTMLTQVVARVNPRMGLLETLVVGAAFTLWMMPDFKAADFLACAMMLAAAALVSARPSMPRFFLLGCAVGVAAWIGRNHGVYGLLGSAGVLLSLRRTPPVSAQLIRVVVALAGGVVVGYLPMLVSSVITPGVFEEWVAVTVRIVQAKSTNLSIPIPRPWWIDWRARPTLDSMSFLLVAGTFVAFPVAFVVLCVLAWRQRADTTCQPATFRAAVAFVLPYAHYAYSRPDAAHLSLGMVPALLVLVIGLQSLSPMRRLGATAVIAAACFTTMAPHHRLREARTASVPVQVVADSLLVSASTKEELSLLYGLADRYAAYGESFVATPFWPGAYAVLQRKAPSWEIYALFPRDDAFQRQEIARWDRANPAFAVVVDALLDGDPAHRFGVTHPLMMRDLESRFLRYPGPTPPNVRVFSPRP